jgi:hypothetical protein
MVKNEDGDLVERGAMDDSLATALMIVISEVNNLGKKIATAA